MSDGRILMTGAVPPSLDAEALRLADELAGPQPRSVLYVADDVTGNRHIEELWADGLDGKPDRAPIRFELVSLDALVTRCHERGRLRTSHTHISSDTRNRIVELAVERLGEGNPFGTESMPSGALVSEVDGVLSLLEFAGIETPEEVRHRFAELGIDREGEATAELLESFHSVRSEVLASERTIRSERYAWVADAPETLREYLVGVDVVVLGNFTLFSPLEAAVVGRLAEDFDTIATVPLVDGTVPVDGGVDRGSERAIRTYHGLGFEHRRVSTPGGHPIAGRGAALRRLYQPPEGGNGVAVDGGITLVRPETPRESIREVARDIRAQMVDGLPPDDIGVILADAAHYDEVIDELFPRFDVPYDRNRAVNLAGTRVGGLAIDLLGLLREPTAGRVLDVVGHPLVRPEIDDASIDVPAVRRAVGRLPTEDADALVDLLEDETEPPAAPSTGAAIRSLRGRLEALQEAPIPEAVQALESLLVDLGVQDAIDGARQTESGLDRGAASLEAVALEELGAVLDSLVEVIAHSGVDGVGEAPERIERAIRMKRVDAGGVDGEGTVTVRRLVDGGTTPYERLYVLGLSDSQFPGNPLRLAFTEAINRSHRDFEEADRQHRARYNLAVKLLSAAEVVLARPRRTQDGDELADAGFLSELGRAGVVEGDQPPAVLRDRSDRPGSAEDLRRLTVDALSIPTATAAVADRVAAAFEAVPELSGSADHVGRGLLCAAHRSKPELTPYDAHLGPETAEALHGVADRSPYSASRFERYANCGFVYYMREVLGIAVEDDIELDPHPGEKGWFVHGLLFRFFDGIQQSDGEPVDLRDHDREEIEERLCRAALDELESRFDDGSSAFRERWLQALLAGLATPELNPYHSPEVPHEGVEDGLLSRFVDAELDLAEVGGPLPAWFEARVGPSHSESETPLLDEAIDVEAPSGRSTRVRGMVDRIDANLGDDAWELAVRDYKTGSRRSRRHTIEGLEFQLPIYAHLAEAAAEAETGSEASVIEAAYYQLPVDGRPAPSDTSIDVETFDRPAELEGFVHALTPERLADIDASIADGVFHPTLLSPWGAGCDRCEYRDVCDVRHHQRQERVDDLAARDTPAYLPDYVAPGEFDIEEVLDGLGGGL